MAEGLNEAIDEMMRDCVTPLWGVAPFSALKNSLISCGGLKRLPENSKSVITAVFPYYCKGVGGSVSRYAAAQDYHIVVSKMLRHAAELLTAHFPANKFVPFCDASPVPEVLAARLAGLGAVGKNGLLITPKYGSFVFIGEIVTDLELEFCENPGGDCFACGRCLTKCPAGAITEHGINRERCVSHLTQKKGPLTKEQQGMVRLAGTIWGCDICQNVCPMNRDITETDIVEFKTDIVNMLTIEEIEDENFDNKYVSRAFMWRGKEILLRNIGILLDTPENNNSEDYLKE
jgi:epoxyqueuosine reductase QueG